MYVFREMYSAIVAEVPIVSDPQTMVNIHLLNKLGKASKLIIGGQALSHCVKYTTEDIIKYFEAMKFPLSNITLLLDGKSTLRFYFPIMHL